MGRLRVREAALIFYDTILPFMKFIFSFLLFFTGVVVAHAQITITEVMYDLEGSDTDREWVEIQNTSSGGIDFSLWHFAEGKVNHKVEIVQGSAILPPGGYAVLVDKMESFKADWPQFSGTIFDSSFSLNNTGATLVVRDADSNDIDSFLYSSDLGANDDGRSLQKVGGSFVAGIPTPGRPNAASSAPSPVSGSTPTPAASSPTPTPSPSPSGGSTAASVSPSMLKSIHAMIDTSATAMVGGRADFRGSAYGFENKPLENVRFLWNFGDGGTTEGQHVLHTYSFPGTYAVVVSVASGEFSTTAHVTVEAVQADVRLSRISQNGETAYVVYNNSKENIDLSGWRIVAGDATFSLPERSFVVAQGKAVFPSKTTGLSTLAVSYSLLYPHGAVAATGADEQSFVTVFPVLPMTSANLIVPTLVAKEEVAVRNTIKKKMIPVKKEEAATLFAQTLATKTEEVVSMSGEEAVRRSSGDSSLYKWLGALVVLISVSAGAAVYVRKKESDTITLID